MKRVKGGKRRSVTLSTIKIQINKYIPLIESSPLLYSPLVKKEKKLLYYNINVSWVEQQENSIIIVLSKIQALNIFYLWHLQYNITENKENKNLTYLYFLVSRNLESNVFNFVLSCFVLWTKLFSAQIALRTIWYYSWFQATVSKISSPTPSPPNVLFFFIVNKCWILTILGENTDILKQKIERRESGSIHSKDRFLF